MQPLRSFAAFAGAALVLGACTPSPEPSGDVTSGPADGPAIEIVALDNLFDPQTIEAEPGEEVVVEVTNEGNIPHDFEVEALGVNTGPIAAGGVATARFVMPDETTPFACTYHPGMTGELAS